MRRIYLLFVLFPVFLFSECRRYHDTRRLLDEVESFSAINPDSALIVLSSIPRWYLNDSEIMARYALLYTQAQDRCSIPVDNDSLIRYSVEYFRHHGTSFDRFRSLYYLGQVYQNAGKRDLALNLYIEAEKMADAHIPSVFMYSLYGNKCLIYRDIYDFERALYSELRARKYIDILSRSDLLFRHRLNLAALYFYSGKNEIANRYLDTLSLSLGDASESALQTYYKFRTDRMLTEGIEKESVGRLLDSIRDVYPEWMDKDFLKQWASAYTRCGQPSKAIEVISHIPKNGYDAYYYTVLSATLDSLGRHEESLAAYKRYIALSDSLDMVLYRQDTRFLEERHEREMRAERQKLLSVVLGFVLLMLVSLGIVSFKRRHRENRRLKAMLASLQEEYRDLRDVLKKNEQISGEARKRLGERVKALGAFLSSGAPNSLDLVSNELERLSADRKTLLETIGLLYGMYYPKFVSFLLEKDLTVAEVGYCCLILLGLRVNETGTVIGRKSVYNISSSIRNKLAVGDVNLSTWLKYQFQESIFI